MRSRPLVALSVLASATLLLAGCSGPNTPASDATPSPAATSAACLADLQSGAASDAVEVSGTGADVTLAVPDGTEVTEAERTVVSLGTGENVAPGDFVSLRYQLLDGSTNEIVSSSDRGADGVVPVLLAAQQPQQISDPTQSTLFTVVAECIPLGSSALVILPPAEADLSPSVLYVETVDELPTIASGSAVDATPGMPEVTLADNGAPSVTIPDADVPTETEISLLKKGDGPVVGEGDLVTVQYLGVKWSDGSEFDSSWSRDAMPTQFPTTGVVTGFKLALEGQAVGSQVLAVIPPKDGYGDAEGSELQNETLVFVVDILGTTPAEVVQ